MRPGILFVCIGNSCRSIMAEAVTRHYWGGTIRAFSAGTYPLGHITAHTLEVLRERDIPTDGLASKGFSAISFKEIQRVVSLSGESLAPFLPGSFSGKVIPCYVHDPYGRGLPVFRQTLETIERLLRKHLDQWLDRPTKTL